MVHGKTHKLSGNQMGGTNLLVNSQLDGIEILPDERWVQIVDFPLYFISDYGRVYSTQSQKILKANSQQYPRVNLYNAKGKQFVRIHVLVASYFVNKKSPEHKVVNHLDENKTNNYYKNLEWTSYKGNNRHNNLHVKNSIKSYETRKSNTARPVIQLDKSGNCVKRWESQYAIYDEYGYSKCAHLTAVLNGRRKSTLGYLWKWADSLNTK